MRVNTSFHLVTPLVDVGIRYLNFGNIWDYEEHVGWWVSPSTSAILDHLAISSDEDN